MDRSQNHEEVGFAVARYTKHLFVYPYYPSKTQFIGSSEESENPSGRFGVFSSETVKPVSRETGLLRGKATRQEAEVPTSNALLREQWH
jgi:hypothetical protein